MAHKVIKFNSITFEYKNMRVWACIFDLKVIARNFANLFAYWTRRDSPHPKKWQRRLRGSRSAFSFKKTTHNANIPEALKDTVMFPPFGVTGKPLVTTSVSRYAIRGLVAAVPVSL